MSIHTIVTGGEQDFSDILGFFTGLYIFYSGFRDIRIERLINDTAISPIRSLAAGTVKISGKVKSPTPAIKDPIFSKDCCYYNITVSKLTSDDWEIVHQSVSSKPILLSDETGSILVQPKAAKLLMKKTVNWELQETFLVEELPGAEHTYARSLCPNGQVKIEAYIFYPDETLCVYGLAAPPENSKRSSYEESLRAFKSALTDQPDLIVRQGAGIDFVITNELQRNFIWDMEWHSALKIFGGPALAITCAVYLATSLHLF